MDCHKMSIPSDSMTSTWQETRHPFEEVHLQRRRGREKSPAKNSTIFNPHRVRKALRCMSFFFGWLLYITRGWKLLVKTSLFLWWFKRFKRPGFRKWCKRRCNTSSLSGDLCFFLWCLDILLWRWSGALVVSLWCFAYGGCVRNKSIGLPQTTFFWIVITSNFIWYMRWGETY